MFEYYSDNTGARKARLARPAEELIPGINSFFEEYEVNSVIIHSDKKPPLKKKIERKCWFCNKMMPDVSFKKDAHTIPEFLKNRHMVSDIECDACNQLFSKYETQLSYFLGLTRTLSYLEGKEGIPKFRTPDKKLEVEFNHQDDRLTIISEGNENNHWTIDEKNKKMIFHSVKHPYIPVQVYKSLLKIGLCYIPENEIKNFKKAFQFLQDSTNDEKVKGHPVIKLYIHLLAGVQIPRPLVFRLKRKQDAKHTYCPEWCYIIYAGNYVFQFFMGGNQKDVEIFLKEKLIHLPSCPPFMSPEYVSAHGVPRMGIYDLSSSEKVYNEPQNITMTYDSINFPSQ